MHTDKEKLKWHEEKWGENEEPDETPTERPHCDNSSLKNQDKNFNEKPIIIDGVEVQQCLFIGVNGLTAYKIPYCREFTNNCKDNPNCYFKQLARKTQECEELKKELKKLKRQYKLSCLDCEYKDTKADVDRYRKALEEIERYCTDYCNDCSDGDNPLETYDKCINCVSADIKDIVNKTKEEE